MPSTMEIVPRQSSAALRNQPEVSAAAKPMVVRPLPSHFAEPLEIPARAEASLPRRRVVLFALAGWVLLGFIAALTARAETDAELWAAAGGWLTFTELLGLLVLAA